MINPPGTLTCFAILWLRGDRSEIRVHQSFGTALGAMRSRTLSSPPEATVRLEEGTGQSQATNTRPAETIANTPPNFRPAHEATENNRPHKRAHTQAPPPTSRKPPRPHTTNT